MSILFFASIGLRLEYARMRELVPDEAYYWVWSKHLAPGYLDHPPMVAYLIHAGTSVGGDTELGVRWPAAVMAIAIAAIVAVVTLRVSSSKLAGALAAIVLLASPMTAVLGTIVTPDTPACFFGICAIACAVFAVTRPAPDVIELPAEKGGSKKKSKQPPPPEPRRMPPFLLWIFCGLFTGAALLSKYTMILVPAAVFLALVSSPQGRRELMRPSVWIGVLIAAAVFLPNIHWNATHDWKSFRFQLHHGMGEDSMPWWKSLLFYIGGQAGVWTPVLFGFTIFVMVFLWRRFATLSLAERILLVSGTLPLVFFAYTSLRHTPEANWPIFGYLPLTVLIARFAAESLPARKWLETGIAVALVCTIVVQTPEIMNWIPKNRMESIPDKWGELFGWRQLGRTLSDRQSQIGPDAPVFASNYENASEAEFYMTGQPDCWTLGSDRPTAFDDFPGRPDLGLLRHLIYVRNAKPDKPNGPLPDILTKSFPHLDLGDFYAFQFGRVLRMRQIVVASRGFEPMIIMSPATQASPVTQPTPNPKAP